ncbi:hypothetical protein Vafri_7364 [Volvox africanus]|uniref:Uncharacterized protein n=1 Tax=Volvox africanus TaxID=51714 RepID=A0A8J4B097_9CHLO|nr:hypothetical protein Vafri_7364 [Volvox africanus]
MVWDVTTSNALSFCTSTQHLVAGWLVNSCSSWVKDPRVRDVNLGNLSMLFRPSMSSASGCAAASCLGELATEPPSLVPAPCGVSSMVSLVAPRFVVMRPSATASCSRNVRLQNVGNTWVGLWRRLPLVPRSEGG